MGNPKTAGTGPVVPSEIELDEPLVASGVERVVLALGLDRLDCLQFLAAYDALAVIIRDVVASARSDVNVGRTDAEDRRP